MKGKEFKMEFHWVPLEEMKNIEVYPTNVVELMNTVEQQGAQHFVYQE